MNADRENVGTTNERPAEEKKKLPWRNRLYDRLPFSLDQVEKFIIAVSVLIILLILIGIFIR